MTQDLRFAAGRLITRLLKERRMSQADLANITGYGRSTISHAISDRRFSMQFAEQCVDAFLSVPAQVARPVNPVSLLNVVCLAMIEERFEDILEPGPLQALIGAMRILLSCGLLEERFDLTALDELVETGRWEYQESRDPVATANLFLKWRRAK